ncbi:MAG: protein disulfide oxidoreductase, partial [Armatimonadetes bacterium]|nr:protein disulfide oxidoreductase [Armatimonadota bacterium]
MSIARRAPDLAQIAAGRLAEPARTAAERGAASFYTDLGLPPDTLRVCHGTSCVLHGAERLHQRLAPEAACGHAYCLGHCDRSPAVLRPDGNVVDACDDRATDEVLHGDGAGSVDIRALCDQPIVLERLVHGDHSSLAAARRAGVYETIEAAVRRPPGELLDTVQRGRLRGRGGAGFPVGAKWQACADTPAERRFVVANGDEGDPGSFVDRVLMEQDPHALLEGMALCGHAVGAREGVVFIRSEYPRAVEVMQRAIEEAEEAGVLGGFEVVVCQGMGSYVCGEETALLNAIEGRRGEVRL